jgi:hypothetical protein
MHCASAEMDGQKRFMVRGNCYAYLVAKHDGDDAGWSHSADSFIVLR